MVNLLDTLPARTAIDRSRVVRVNGAVISRAAIAREVQNHEAPTPAEAWTKAARALAVRELLLQEARRIGLVAEPEQDEAGRRETDEEALVRMLVAREVQTPQPSEQECQRMFEANRATFRAPDLFEVRHILLPADPRDETTRAAAKDEARELIGLLRLDEAQFEALAVACSACPSGKVGGSLGQIGPGQTVPEFESALADLPVGMVAPEPVETRYGFHVVHVERRMEARPLPFELAKATVARWLSQRVYHAAVRQYIGLLAGRATIEGVDLAAAPSPLVQ